MGSGSVLLRQEQDSGRFADHHIELSDSDEETKYFISRPTENGHGHLVILPSWPPPNHGLAVLRGSFSLPFPVSSTYPPKMFPTSPYALKRYLIMCHFECKIGFPLLMNL